MWVVEKFKVLKYVVICFIDQCASALCSVPRSGSPSTSLVNGSPHPSYKRESTTSPADYEYKKNVEFLKRGEELIYMFDIQLQVIFCSPADGPITTGFYKLRAL